jgi:hypothetical protein
MKRIQSLYERIIDQPAETWQRRSIQSKVLDRGLDGPPCPQGWPLRLEEHNLLIGFDDPSRRTVARGLPGKGGAERVLPYPIAW